MTVRCPTLTKKSGRMDDQSFFRVAMKAARQSARTKWFGRAAVATYASSRKESM
jgi:hypothetical protein